MMWWTKRRLLGSLSSNTPSERDRALEELVKIGEPAVETFAGVLKDRSLSTTARVAAAKGMGRIGGARSLSLLIDVALNDSDTELRAAAVNVVSAFSPKEARSMLCQTLKDPADEVWRSSAIALGKIGDGRAVSALVELLNDGSASQRQTVAGILRDIGDLSAAPALASAMCDDDKAVKSTAISALSKFGKAMPLNLVVAAANNDDARQRGEVVSFLESLAEQAVPSMIDLLRHRHYDVACRAASFLGRSGDVRAITPLTLVSNDKDRAYLLQRAAIQALDALGWQPSNSQERAMRAAASGLYQEAVKEGPIAVPFLTEEILLRRTEVVIPMCKVGGEEISLAFATALRSACYMSDSTLRMALVKALTEVGDSKTIQLLRDILSERGPARYDSSRADLIVALANLGDISIVSELVSQIDFESNEGSRDRARTLVTLLEHILEQSAACVRIEDLHLLSKTQDIVIVVGACAFKSREVVSYAGARQLARQELVRRGMPAD